MSLLGPAPLVCEDSRGIEKDGESCASEFTAQPRGRMGRRPGRKRQRSKPKIKV